MIDLPIICSDQNANKNVTLISATVRDKEKKREGRSNIVDSPPSSLPASRCIILRGARCNVRAQHPSRLAELDRATPE